MTYEYRDPSTVDVFIGHAREDAPIATQLYDRLCEWGLRVFLDRIDIESNTNIRTKINQALENAKVVVVLWTSASISRNWVLSEADDALERKKLFQVIVDDAKAPIGFNQMLAFKVETREGYLEEPTLSKLVEKLRVRAKIKGPNERIIHPRRLGEDWGCDDLAVGGPAPGTDMFASFHPCDTTGIFSLMHVETTSGWVKEGLAGARELHIPFEADPESEKTDDGQVAGLSDNTSDEAEGIRYLRIKNEVFFINDPIRPYSIQIGGLRSQRTHASPGYIKCSLSENELRLVPKAEPAIVELLAEVLEDSDNLQNLWDHLSTWSEEWKLSEEQRGEKVERIRDLISRNPNSPENIQKERCIFCRNFFRESISEPLQGAERGLGVYILPNSFPFGPYFHYVVITEDPVHLWEALRFKHVVGMNLAILQLLERYRATPEHPVGHAAGVEYGFNSTVKHLVLGQRSHSSAGASIPHVHKQAWGMAPRTSNLAEHLILISDAYWRQGIDYQANYLATLDDRGNHAFSYVIWKDEHVTLHVPYGQCSLHELQVMTNEPTDHMLKLSTEQMISLSKAEYIALRLYAALGVTSFNHIVLSKLFNDHRAPRFRMVVAFITREIDLAMSELSMLYVVDKHPWDSCVIIQEKWKEIRDQIEGEMNDWSLPDTADGEQS